MGAGARVVTRCEVRVGACVYVGDTDRVVPFYRDTLGFHTAWDGGDFAEFETASGELALFMSSRKQFTETIGETYVPPKGINQTFEVALWLPALPMSMRIRAARDAGRPLSGRSAHHLPFGIRPFPVADPEGNPLEIGCTSEP